jgi:hypothetical protein
MAAPHAWAHRCVMSGSHGETSIGPPGGSPAAEHAYVVSGATLDGDSIGPVFATARQAHAMARTAIAGIGGTVRVLRHTSDGWREIARYTDTGKRRDALPPNVVTITILPAHSTAS